MNVEESPRTRDVSWRHSFAVRFAVVWAFVLGGAVGLSGWISYRDSRQQLIDGLTQTVRQDVSVIEVRLTSWLAGLGEDIRAASESPVVQRFIDAVDQPEEKIWRSLVEDSFRAVFAGKPTYFQMRLLRVGGQREGQEMLRLDRKGDKLVITPQDQLQQKSDRDYFREALLVPQGEVYYSIINLNRDFGEITRPFRPTIRTAVRIGSDSDQEMMLIINADLGPLFAELVKLASPEAQIFLGQENGDFVYHPDPKALFASDLGHDQKFSDQTSQTLVEQRKISFGQSPRRVLDLEVSLADSGWKPGLAELKRQGLWVTFLAVIAGAVVALLIAWFFARRLSRLSRALRLFDGRESRLDRDPLDDGRRDEIGVALARFEEMANKVRSYVQELDESRKVAEEADAAKANFLAVMSHEIRTPLNAVVGLVRALRDNEPNAKQRPLLNSLQSSVDNLVSLLNTSLDHTRLSEGKMHFSNEHFNASQLGTEVLNSMRPLASRKGIGLEARIQEELWVRGDEVRLRQVLNNLLNNALKFTEHGEVSLSLRYDDGHLFGEVADTGPGIAPEDRDRVFAPFYTKTHTGSGVGLGLSVSREIIEQQGGQLGLKVSGTVGSVFEFKLPCASALAKTDSGQGSYPFVDFHGKGLQILYVEDVISNQEVMALTLEGSGVNLGFAKTGREAIEKCEQGRFDLIFLDLQLPDMSGLELASLLKESLTQVPMILVTAQSTGLASESETLVRDVIIKPYTKERVIDVINQQLSFDVKKLWKKDDLKGLERRNRLLRIASQEFQEAAESLSKLGDSPLDDWVRDRRHRMTTALSLFQLERLEAALTHRDGDWALWKQELISSFQEAAIILDQSHKGSQDFFQ